MNQSVLIGILIPFIGTTLGALCVYFMKQEMPLKIEKRLSGFAAGVMVSASIWGLLIPSMEQSSHLNELKVVPAVVGFWAGTLFLLMIDNLIPHLHIHSEEPEGIKSSFSDTVMMFLAVTIHNIPEGMAVGIVYASLLQGLGSYTYMSALALALGIAIQNFPEGAIISMPFYSKGYSKNQSFLLGMFSGIVEPVAALLTIVIAKYVTQFMPYLLSFAAGAMMYVVVEDLIPETSRGSHSNDGTIFFAIGMTIMFVLDILLS